MTNYEKILKLSDEDAVKFSISLPKELHKSLCLGQTRYLCRYGTLSDGHEKITPAQRYYQAIKEMYYLGQNVQNTKALAMLAQADLLDAEEALSTCDTEAQKLRNKAKKLQAETSLVSSLVTIEEQLRQIDEYNKIRIELKEEVETKYPEGIEQAEADNWKAVFEYRMNKERVPGMARELVSNIPLDPHTKAELGYKYGRMDAIAPLAIANPKKCYELENKLKLLEEKR